MGECMCVMLFVHALSLAWIIFLWVLPILVYCCILNTQERGRTTTDTDKLYFGPREVAKVLGVSEYLIYRQIHEGEIPHRTIGQRILVPGWWVRGEPESATARVK